ncbi:MAG: FliA/WhiG family RNA polymerase sigma factor [Candidatus Marinimicrobia bacterium]|nr:FliA/WhiG family RNA polymerase sigma factor [Candidatus Neomarinimicrobiota bacterium]
MIQKQQTTVSDGDSLVNTYIHTQHPRDKELAVKAYLNLVKHIVGRLNIPEHLDLRREDVYQYGVVGLLNALDRFKPSVGVTFKTFAYRRIQGEIIDAVRKQGGLSRDQIRMQKLIIEATEVLRGDLNRDPTLDEICEEAGITLQDYYMLQQLNNLNFTISLDKSSHDDGDEHLTPKDTIVDESQIPPDKQIDLNGVKDDLKHILTKLPERERLILVLYYYEELTLFDIGQVLDISESRVSQLMNKTLAWVRSQLNS